MGDYTLKRAGYRCMTCNKPFHADTPYECEISIYTSFILKLRCPHCNGIELTLGLNLSATENDALRVDGSEHERARNWHYNGETGMSALTIFRHFVGEPNPTPTHPHDAADLRRCIYLFRHMPEWSSRISELATLSPQWANLAANWDRIIDTYVKDRDTNGGVFKNTNALLASLAQTTTN